jgi:hypothetical protein
MKHISQNDGSSRQGTHRDDLVIEIEKNMHPVAI